jgi:RNA polymerase sigma-70 factor (ECF subfamily)
MNHNSESTGGDAARFATTSWSVILCAGGSGSESRDALQQLCEAYWYPLYAWLRRKKYTAADAEDVTEGLFAQLRSLHR